MKYILYLFILTSLFACDFNINKKVSVAEILDEEWKTFNWSDIDEYPSFISCDSLLAISQKKECFISTLSNQISNDLMGNSEIVNRTIQDTVILNFTISKQGEIILEELNIDDNIKELKNIIDISFQSSIEKLPKILPAIKRGQHVNVNFTLPIFVSTE